MCGASAGSSNSASPSGPVTPAATGRYRARAYTGTPTAGVPSAPVTATVSDRGGASATVAGKSSAEGNLSSVPSPSAPPGPRVIGCGKTVRPSRVPTGSRNAPSAPVRVV